MLHELVGEESIGFCVVDQFDEPERCQEELGQHVFVEVLSRGFELPLRQVSQIVLGFPDEFFRAHESVNHESPARNHSGDPGAAAVAALVSFSGWNGVLLQPPDSAPVRDVQHLDSGKQNLEHASAELVSQKHVGVYLVNSSNEGLQHLALVLESNHVQIFFLLQNLGEVEGQGFFVQLSHQREPTHWLRVVSRAILVNVVVDQAGDHGDFICIVSRASGLDGEGES